MKEIVLLDVTPLSLGIETVGSVFTKLIPRNTTIPTRKSQVFSTAVDSQTAVEVKVLQGERAMADDNKLLGKFNLVGIPPAPRGVPQIEVTFSIDANGIVHVTAKDKNTQKSQQITVQSSGGLSDDEINRFVQEAEQYAEADKKRRDVAETKNEAESLIYSVEKSMEDNAAHIPQNEKDALHNDVVQVRDALQSENPEQLKEKVESLQQKSMKLYEIISKSQGGSAGGSAEPAKEDTAKEAEYRDVEDKK